MITRTFDAQMNSYKIITMDQGHDFVSDSLSGFPIFYLTPPLLLLLLLLPHLDQVFVSDEFEELDITDVSWQAFLYILFLNDILV